MIIAYERISAFSREMLPKSLYGGDERCGQRRVCPTTLFIFCSDCKQRVKERCLHSEQKALVLDLFITKPVFYFRAVCSVALSILLIQNLLVRCI